MRRSALADALVEQQAHPAHPPAAGHDDAATDDGLVTEFPFVLPRGYVDPAGVRHRDGVMRLATARDELCRCGTTGSARTRPT